MIVALLLIAVLFGGLSYYGFSHDDLATGFLMLGGFIYVVIILIHFFRTAKK